MSMGRLLASSTAVALLMALAAPALAAVPPGTLDANHACSGAACNVQGKVFYPSVNAPVSPGSTDAVTLGQTFKPTVSGGLTGVSIDVGRLSGVVVPVTLTVQVVTIDGGGVPQIGNVLASEDIATGTADWPSAGNHGWLDVTFSSPPAVTAGQGYAIVLGPSALSATPWLTWEIDSTSDGAYADYADGEAYGGSLDRTTGNWVWNRMFDWLAGSGTGNADFAFRTYVEAAAPTATPTAQPTATPTAQPTATGTTQPTDGTPSVDVTIPPTDVAGAARTETATPGWLALLVVLGGITAALLPVNRLRQVRRRR